jgi:hypothetical protein
VIAICDFGFRKNVTDARAAERPAARTPKQRWIGSTAKKSASRSKQK